ncbi:hypothetical protein P4571_18415 [Niallia alba]|uniref:hypothetical protein n=1 Tax=Niallia alba TaxID=2729105 RepID=UPI002E1F9DE2|nr:hypothetical protein [Niallia alba]
MEFIKRPYNNIKKINLFALFWCVILVIIILLFTIPASKYMVLQDAFKFLFSLDFYEAESVEKISDSTTITTTNLMFDSTKLSIYKILNAGKIVLWVLTAGMLLRFLFKQPKNKVHKTINGGE